MHIIISLLNLIRDFFLYKLNIMMSSMYFTTSLLPLYFTTALPLVEIYIAFLYTAFTIKLYFTLTKPLNQKSFDLYI